MDSSVRLLKSSHRHLYLPHSRSHSLLFEKPLYSIPKTPSFPPFPSLPPPSNRLFYNHHPHSTPNSPHFPSIPFRFPPNPLNLQHPFNLSICSHHFARIFSNPNRSLFSWHYAPDAEKGQQNGVLQNKGPVVTAVLLGWLGAKPKHLKRYVELYNAKGIHAITFVASVRDVLSFDLGRKLEERIRVLANELADWLSKSERDGRERVLVFHTFSNTGWLAYGAILDHLQARQDLLEKIKGCIVDSGGDPNIDPKVWAAGFTAALLKKRSSSAYPSIEAGEGNEVEHGVTVSQVQEKEPLLIETLLLSAFEKLFLYLLHLPDINQRLMKIIHALKNQPPFPQLCLYSTADKVIPIVSVESFIEDQRRSGREVLSYNFVSSPHVDHYRTFPRLYASQLENFMKKCLVAVKK